VGGGEWSADDGTDRPRGYRLFSRKASMSVAGRGDGAGEGVRQGVRQVWVREVAGIVALPFFRRRKGGGGGTGVGRVSTRAGSGNRNCPGHIKTEGPGLGGRVRGRRLKSVQPPGPNMLGPTAGRAKDGAWIRGGALAAGGTGPGEGMFNST